MYSKDAEIEENCIKIEAALNQLFESKNSNKKNPYEGMCYVASVVLKKLVGRKVILWKVKDHNGQFHWWCETPDGEVIDLTSKLIPTERQTIVKVFLIKILPFKFDR